MMHVKRTIRTQAWTLACLAGLLFSAELYAQTPVEGVALATNTTLAANLKSLSGKRVTLYLKSGASLGGIVKSVGEHLVHLEKLDNNRDFYDALVSMEQIAAIDTRARSR